MAGELPEIFARVAGLLLTEPVVDRAVANLAQAAHESLPGSVGAGAHSSMPKAGRRARPPQTTS